MSHPWLNTLSECAICHFSAPWNRVWEQNGDFTQLASACKVSREERMRGQQEYPLSCPHCSSSFPILSLFLFLPLGPPFLPDPPYLPVFFCSSSTSYHLCSYSVSLSLPFPSLLLSFSSFSPQLLLSFCLLLPSIFMLLLLSLFLLSLPALLFFALPSWPSEVNQRSHPLSHLLYFPHLDNSTPSSFPLTVSLISYALHIQIICQWVTLREQSFDLRVHLW